MRFVRAAAAASLLVSFASPVAAQVSCANPDNLCTGDPCVTTNLTVQTPCVADFGTRTLIIGGALTVPNAGTLQFTAASIMVQGRIVGPGASVSLIANTGPIELDTEIDVDSAVAGSLLVNAVAGDIDVKTRLKARPGGSITLDAGGTLETRVSAVIEVDDGGTILLSGDAGVTIGGKLFAGGQQSGILQIDSSAGVVRLDQSIRMSGPAPSTITINGTNGVLVNENIRADKGEPGSSVTLTSSAGDVVVNSKVSAAGDNGGTIVMQAPNGTVGPRGVEAKGKFDGGAVTMTAATISLLDNVVAKGGNNGGSIQLTGSALVSLASATLDVSGKQNGGQVGLLGDAGSGDVIVASSAIKAGGGFGNGGLVVVSAPAGSVDLGAKINATTHGVTSGSIFIDGDALTIGPKTILDVDGGFIGGEIRMSQSGAGLFALTATCEARDNGVIEALAPAGSLTARGKFRAGPAGCVGMSSLGVLDTAGVVADVPLTPSCP